MKQTIPEISPNGSRSVEWVKSTDYVLPERHEFDWEATKQIYIKFIMTEIVNGSKGMAEEFEFRSLKKKIDRYLKKKKNGVIDNRTVEAVINAKWTYIKEKDEGKVFHGEKLFTLMVILSRDRNKEEKCGNIWCNNIYTLRCTKCKTASYCSQQCNKKFWPYHKMACASLKVHGHCKQNCLTEVD